MWILFLILMCSAANADVYVVTAQDKSVYSVSEQNDAIVPNGYKKDIIKGKNIDSLGLNANVALYDYDGGKFTMNAGRVSAKNKEEQDQILLEQDKAAKRASAIAKFKAMGLTDDEAAALIH